VVVANPTSAAPVSYTLQMDPSPEVPLEVTEIPLGQPCAAQTQITAEPAILNVQVARLTVRLGTLVAHLTSGGRAISGKTVMFTTLSGGPLCSAPTDASGTARCSNPLGVVQSLGYRASFAGDGSYLASSARGDLIRLLTLSVL
jgi:hypothetical protein